MSIDLEMHDVPQESTLKIYKVPPHVKARNSKAYQPTVVSIGPYHYGLPQLGGTEIHKRRAQEKLVELSGLTIDHYKVEMMSIVRTLKESYADLDLDEWSDDDKFVDQMILDGCFLIAFLREPIDLFRNFPRDDPIFSKHGHAVNYNAVKQDLLMGENQLPNLVLQTLLKTSGKPPDAIFQWIRHGVKEPGFHMLETHMAGLLELGVESTQHKALGLCASELYQSNVQFKKAKNYVDMKFDNGILTLPVIIIDEHIISTYLNMNAQAISRASPTAKVFTFYARLMGTLVRSGKDVRLLESRGIIINELHNRDLEAAVEVIQEIARGTFTLENVIDSNGLSYNTMQEDLERFCQRKENKLKKTLGRWLTELYDTHFKSPWTGLSLLAAIVLLALTATQTYYAIQSYKYSVLSYKKQP